MKTLLLAFAMMTVLVACNREDARTEFNEQRMEADKELNEEVKSSNEDIMEARQERAEDVQSAREDLADEQKEEAEDAAEDMEDRNEEIRK